MERLPKEEELELIRRFQEEGDKKAFDTVFLSNIRLAFKMASKYDAKRMDRQDMAQCAMVGLANAINKFSPDFGVPFGTYAANWMKGAIRREMMRMSNQVKIATTDELTKAVFNISYAVPFGQKMTDKRRKDLAEKLNIDVKTVKEIEVRMKTTYNGVVHTDLSDSDMETGQNQQLADPKPESESLVLDQVNAEQRRKRLLKCLEGMTERQKMVIKRRYLIDHEEQREGQREIAARLGVSYQAIQQTEKKALEVFRKNIENMGDASFWL